MGNENVNFFVLIVDNAGNFFKGICEILTIFFIFYTPHFLHSSFSTLPNLHTHYCPPLPPVALVEKKNYCLAHMTRASLLFHVFLIAVCGRLALTSSMGLLAQLTADFT